MNIVVLGLSITSSWGNGHATTYRALVRGLEQRGHKVLFLERDVPWYAENRDMPRPPFGTTELYDSVAQVKDRFTRQVRQADLVIVGSYVPQGVAIGEWVVDTAQGVTAFYDIDTPVTIAKLNRNDTEYLTRALVKRYDLYLSFTGGPTLERLEKQFGAPAARALYCSVDPQLYYPEDKAIEWDLGYLGTYSADRQPALDRLLIQPAAMCTQQRFVVAGPMYPQEIQWPPNVTRTEHLAPNLHRGFYNSQRYTLNITRADMVAAGYSPSVRLFEAAACGTPIISDAWAGLETLFAPGKEILIARCPEEVQEYLTNLPASARSEISQAARTKVLNAHTGEHRAVELEAYVSSLAMR
ncbi:MAG: glycosyltransferase [Bryobacterales bacterium]|nr:glycosyltransferase [Bryobacterales bacterium]